MPYGRNSFSPAIVLAEVSSAIARASGDEELAAQVVANLLGSPIRFVSVEQELATAAAIIGRTQRIRGCDAIYVALAQSMGRELVTLDAEQLTRAASLVAVRRPEPPETATGRGPAPNPG